MFPGQSIVEWLVRSTITVTALFAVIAAIQFLLGKHLSPRFRYCLWLVPFVREMFPSSLWSSRNLAAWTSYSSIDAVIIQRLAMIGLIIWGAGVTFCVLSACARTLKLHRRVCRKRFHTDAAVMELLEDCKEQLDVRLPLMMVVTDEAKSPSVFGFLRPRILMPANILETCARPEMRLIFLHELAHIRRWDVLWNWIVCLILSLQWFNPFAWAAYRRLCRERELACDEVVLGALPDSDRKSYGRLLLKLVESFSIQNAMRSAMCILERADDLEARIRSIAETRKTRRFGAALTIALGLACFADHLTGNVAPSPMGIVTTAPHEAGPVSVETFAGAGVGGEDGFRTQARFSFIAYTAMAPDGRIWLSEACLSSFWAPAVGGHRIRIIEPNGNVSTLAGSETPGFVNGPSSQARFSGPSGIAFDREGNAFVADRLNHCIRKIDRAGMVSTFAGSIPGFQDGILTAAQFSMPIALAIDKDGTMYVADFNNCRIRRIKDGIVSTVAGGERGDKTGSCLVAQFEGPDDVKIAPDGSLFVSDWANGKIKKIKDGTVSTFVSGLAYCERVTLDGTGNVFITCNGRNRGIYKFSPKGVNLWSTFESKAGYRDGPIEQAQFAFYGNALLLSENSLLISDALNHRLRLVSIR